eukprot:EC720093.1.p1 GENE.EC720093.1~~EC720093.1.p1  ORF type:complete len:100 (+),score=6.82 EC720093.1:143-442(+)
MEGNKNENAERDYPSCLSISGQDSMDTPSTNSEDLVMLVKKQRREHNRNSARLARGRNKEFMRALSLQLEELRQCSERLRTLQAVLQLENQATAAELQK